MDIPVTVFGGLKVLVVLNGWGEDTEVEEVYWMKKDQSRGAAFSDKLHGKLDNGYEYENIIEQAFDYLSVVQRTE